MSRQSAQAFCEQLQSDDALYREVMALGGTAGGELLVAAPRVVEFGVRRGFSFSARELCDAWIELESRRTGDELTETELATVAGGAAKTAQIHFLMFKADGTPVRASSPDLDLAEDFAP